MIVEGWKLWIVPVGLWALYVCWHTGYQAGYSDGHETAWQMSRPAMVVAKIDQPGDFLIEDPKTGGTSLNR